MALPLKLYHCPTPLNCTHTAYCRPPDTADDVVTTSVCAGPSIDQNDVPTSLLLRAPPHPTLIGVNTTASLAVRLIPLTVNDAPTATGTTIPRGDTLTTDATRSPFAPPTVMYVAGPLPPPTPTPLNATHTVPRTPAALFAFTWKVRLVPLVTLIL